MFFSPGGYIKCLQKMNAPCDQLGVFGVWDFCSQLEVAVRGSRGLECSCLHRGVGGPMVLPSSFRMAASKLPWEA